MYQKSQSYDKRFLRYRGVRQKEFFVIFEQFFFFYPLMILQTKYLKKFWNATDRIFCHVGHLTDIIFIFHFGLFFALLPLLTIQKSKIKKQKKKKNPVDIIILHKCTINDNHMYGSGDTVHDGRTEKTTYRGGCPT